MTNCNRGDVVLVAFLFTDETGLKKRPALVISSNTYNKNRNEIIIAGITSQIKHMYYGDYLLKDWHKAGLLAPSIATAIFQTVKQNMVERKLGTMPMTDMEEIEKKIHMAVFV